MGVSISTPRELNFQGGFIVSEPGAKAVEARPKRKSSAVSSGRRLFVEGDANSPWSRRFRDLCAGHTSDLGGREALSEAQASLIRRASALECELERMEGQMSAGVAVDLDVFARAASHLRRILESLGLERKARPVQSFEEYRRRHAQQIGAPQKREESQ